MFELPDGNYRYAVSAGGHTTAQGSFTINGEGYLELQIKKIEWRCNHEKNL